MVSDAYKLGEKQFYCSYLKEEEPGGLAHKGLYGQNQCCLECQMVWDVFSSTLCHEDLPMGASTICSEIKEFFDLHLLAN